MEIQWYPGHMTKAKRAMAEDIKLIDIVIELLDARAPLSSKNPDIDELAKNKFRLIILNKADLADKSVTARWKSYYGEKDIKTIDLNSRDSGGFKQITPIIKEVCKEKIERDRKRGIKNRPVRAMIVGIPNVGKSTFINSFAKKACTKVGNKPGVTKGKQWIKLNKEVELLDTPGILWPKFEDERIGKRLAILGSIKDEILNITELSLGLLDQLKSDYPGVLKERYEINEDLDSPLLLAEIADKRQCIKKGGEPDIDKACLILIDDFRSGKLGRITLDRPEE
ncbi:MAG: ribosome biogenesis GTPase YlqF [Lachnospiraceae bacterium]|nr:ribosome biogenesis GTPase YlqF [Lachnospiraceae bacterium]